MYSAPFVFDPKIAKGKEIFDQITSGKITLEQNEHMLKAIGTSKEEVVKGIADTSRKIEGSGSAKMFRQKGQEALQQTVQKSLTDKNSVGAPVALTCDSIFNRLKRMLGE